MDYAGKSFILLHKKFKEWEWYDNPPTRLVFEHCLLSVNYEDENWRGQKIKRGQFPTSVEKIATANGLTIQQTRTALNNLQLTNEITIQTTNRYSIITVNNWDLYQPEQQTKKRIRQQTNNKPTNKQNGGSNNNTYNNINNNIYSNNIISLSNKKKISKNEREILKNYLLKKKRTKPIDDIDAYIGLLVKNGDVEYQLERALKWHEKQEQKKQEVKNAAAEKIENIQETPEEREKIAEVLKKTKANLAQKIRKGD